MITRISEALADRLSKKTNRQDKKDELRYGFEILIGGMITPSLMYAFALIFHVFMICFVLSATFAVFRVITGGYHFSSFWRCLTLTIVIMLGLSKLLEGVQEFTANQLLVGIIIVTLLGVFISSRYVPATDSYRPKSEQEKRKLKKITMVLLALWFVVIGSLVFLLGSHKLIEATIAGLFAQFMTIIPTGSRVLSFIDKIQFRKKVN
jgi:accessory gene regulator B